MKPTTRCVFCDAPTDTPLCGSCTGLLKRAHAGSRRRARAIAPPRVLSPADVEQAIREAAVRFDVSRADILSRRQHTRITQARGFVMWTLRKRRFTVADIGSALGYHHTTVIYWVRRWNATPNFTTVPQELTHAA